VDFEWRGGVELNFSSLCYKFLMLEKFYVISYQRILQWLQRMEK
jgi:hypothetical protein